MMGRGRGTMRASHLSQTHHVTRRDHARVAHFAVDVAALGHGCREAKSTSNGFNLIEFRADFPRVRHLVMAALAAAAALRRQAEAMAQRLHTEVRSTYPTLAAADTPRCTHA